MELLDHNNQQVLWNAFIKLPRNEVINNKRQLFHNVISKYYDKYGTDKLRIERLREINRDIVNDLYSEISDITGIRESKNTINDASLQSTQNSVQKKVYFETEEEKTSRYFKEKQEQYDSMNKKPDVKMPVELETISDDGAINNMDQLIKEYVDERKKDIPMYNPILTDNTSVDVDEDKYDSMNKKIVEIKNDLVSIFDRLNNLESTIKIFSKNNE